MMEPLLIKGAAVSIAAFAGCIATDKSINRLIRWPVLVALSLVAGHLIDLFAYSAGEG